MRARVRAGERAHGAARVRNVNNPHFHTRARNAAQTTQHTLPPPPPHTHLQVPQLDAVQVEHREGVGSGQAQQPQDLEHLDRGDLARKKVHLGRVCVCTVRACAPAYVCVARHSSSRASGTSGACGDLAGVKCGSAGRVACALLGAGGTGVTCMCTRTHASPACSAPA